MIDLVHELEPIPDAPTEPLVLGEVRPRVLVVDDDEDLRWVLDLELRINHFDVCLAADGRAALYELRRSVPNVVLLDLMMPGLGGIGFLSWMSSVVEGPPPPVVVYSAFVSAEAEIGRHTNVVALLRKPAPFHRLVSTIKRVAAAPRG